MSDKYDEVAERIRATGMPMGNYQAGTDKIAAILRETFPAPSGQGEDRVLEHSVWKLDLISKMLHYDDGKPADVQMAEAARLLDATIAALRSRLAEPAQAAPSGLLELQLRLNGAVNDVVGVFPPQTELKKTLIAATNDYINGVADALAVEQAKHTPSGKWIATQTCDVCGADEGLHHYQTNQCPRGGVEAPIGRKQEWADTMYRPRMEWQTDESPAPDAAALREALRKIAYDCDTGEHTAIARAALLRSEPRGEEGRG